MSKADASPGPRPAIRRAPRARRRLRTRIILSFALLGLSLTLLLAFATNWVRGRVEEDMITDLMNRNINAYSQRYYNSGGRQIDLPVQQMRGRVVSREKFESLKEDQPDWYSLGDGIHPVTGRNEDGSPFAYKLAVRKAPDTWFFLAYDMQESVRRTEKFERALYIVVPVFTLFSLLLGWWSASRVMAPVSELARRLRRSGISSDPEALAPHFARDEVGELAKALDDYSERLTDVVQRDREFNADVSHELRTPLAVIRGATELLLAQEDLPDKTRERIRRIDRAARQSSELTQALLLLSRSERQAPTDGETSDVGQVVEQVIDTYRPLLGNKPVEVKIGGDADIHVDAPAAVVAVALGNLIGNAFKYTPAGTVTVRIERSRVVVEDTGPGIKAEDATRLFERGVRGEGVVGKGAGLGLAIVRRLCELYGWEVSLAPRADGGAMAVLDFRADSSRSGPPPL